MSGVLKRQVNRPQSVAPNFSLESRGTGFLLQLSRAANETNNVGYHRAFATFEVSTPVLYVEFMVQRPPQPPDDNPSAGAAWNIIIGSTRGETLTEASNQQDYAAACLGCSSVTVGPSTYFDCIGVLYNSFSRTTTLFENGRVLETSGAHCDDATVIAVQLYSHSDFQGPELIGVIATPKPPPESYGTIG